MYGIIADTGEHENKRHSVIGAQDKRSKHEGKEKKRKEGKRKEKKKKRKRESGTMDTKDVAITISNLTKYEPRPGENTYTRSERVMSQRPGMRQLREPAAQAKE